MTVRVPLSLVVAAAALAAALLALAAPGRARAETSLTASGPLAVALAPGTTVEKALRPRRSGPVGTVAVSVRVTGARAGDLTLALVAPDGRTRVLAEAQGGARRGLGAGPADCSGRPLTFTDQGFDPLGRAAYPYTGWATPEQPLNALKGTQAAGRWTLRIANARGGTAGVLACWKLELGLDIDTVRTARSGGVTATVSYRELDPFVSRVRLRIQGAGATLEAPFAQLKCAQCAASGPFLLGGGGSPLTVTDLDADGTPEVLLDTYTGGAHCCSVSYIFRRAGSGWARTARWWGNPGYRLVDPDKDGRPELQTADDSFGYLVTSWAASGEPVVLYRFEQGRLVDVTRAFPAVVQADAASYWHTARQQLTLEGGEVRGVLAAWAADMANLGKAEEAFARLYELAAQGKLADADGLGTPAGAAYVKALRAHLARSGYLRQSR